MYLAGDIDSRSEEGFTLIELLVTLAIIGVLVAIAVPAYAAFKGRSENKAAESNIREALPAVQAFYLDNDTYVGLGNKPNKKPPGIASYDAGLKATVASGSGKPTLTTYCLTAKVGGTTLSFKGPDAQLWYTNNKCSGAGSASAP